MQARARKVDLRVTSISPGIVETEFYQTSRFGDEEGARKFYGQMKSLQVRLLCSMLSAERFAQRRCGRTTHGATCM